MKEPWSVDNELCPNAHQVDEAFKAKVKGMYDVLNLSLEQLKQWGQIVAKWSEPAKGQFKWEFYLR
jgi:hypothetical protein